MNEEKWGVVLGPDELGVRIDRCLGRAGFGTRRSDIRRETYDIPSSQLRNALDEELLKVKNLGERSLDHIRTLLLYTPGE